MSATMIEPASTTPAGPRRTPGEALRNAGETAARRLVRRGGARIARMDSSRAAHAVLVRAVQLVVPRLFDPSAAGDLDASFELRILDPHGGDPYVSTVVIADRRCRILPGPDPSARVVVTAGVDALVRMTSGGAGWPQLVSAGELELWGDPFLALRFPLLFRIPAGAGEAAVLLALLDSNR